MVSYEFLTATGPFVFMYMPSVFVSAWIFAAFRLYLDRNEFFFFQIHTVVYWTTKSLQGEYVRFYGKKEEITLQSFLPAELTY